MLARTAGRPRGPSDWDHVGQVSWSTSWQLAPQQRVGRQLVDCQALRTLRPSVSTAQEPSQPAELFEPLPLRPRVRVIWNFQSTALPLGPGGPSWPGQLVDPAPAWTKERVGQGSWLIPQTLRPGVRVSRDNWSTLPTLGPSDPGLSWLGQIFDHVTSWTWGLSRPRQLVDSAASRTGIQVDCVSWSMPQTLGPGTRVGRDSRSTPGKLETRTDSAGTAGRPRGCSDKRPSGPEKLVDPAAPRTRDRVGRDIWLNPWTLGPGTESASQLVNPPALRTRERVGQDSWSTLWCLGHGTDSAGTAGRPRPPLTLEPGTESPGTTVHPHSSPDQGKSWPGQPVDPAVPRNLGPRNESAGTNIRTCDLSDTWSESAATGGQLRGISDREPSRS